MKNMKINLSISLLFIALSSPASASLVIDGGIAGDTENGSAANDVIGNQSGFYGANLKVDTDSIVTFDFLGSEAGWDNIFGYGASDSPTYTIENHPAGSSGTVLASGNEQSFSVFASAGSPGIRRIRRDTHSFLIRSPVKKSIYRLL
jgi:hypothetical protein